MLQLANPLASLTANPDRVNIIPGQSGAGERIRTADLPLTSRCHQQGQLLVSWSRPPRSSSGYRSLSMVSVSFWHATGTVCSPPGLASPSVHKYKAQHDYKNDAEHKHQAANAEAMTRLRDQRDTGHRYTVPRECYAQRGCTVSRYVLNTRRSIHWSPYRLGPGRCGRRDCTGLLALVLAILLCWRDRALCGWGFILSPSATLRVAGQSPRGQGGAPRWTNDLGPGALVC